MLSTSGPTRKAERGGGGGGGGGGFCPLQARYKKREGDGLAEEGEVPCLKGGGCHPLNPPPPPPPPPPVSASVSYKIADVIFLNNRLYGLCTTHN